MGKGLCVTRDVGKNKIVTLTHEKSLNPGVIRELTPQCYFENHES